MATIGTEIEKQKKIIADTKKKIDDLKSKEAKRILRVAEKAGYFDVSVTDEQLELGMKQIIEAAKAPPQESIVQTQEASL